MTATPTHATRWLVALPVLWAALVALLALGPVPWVHAAVNTAAGIAVLVAVNRHRPERPLAWRLLSVALLMFAAGNVLWATGADAAGLGASLREATRVGGALAVAATAAAFLAGRRHGRNGDGVIDGAIVVVAGVLLLAHLASTDVAAAELASIVVVLLLVATLVIGGRLLRSTAGVPVAALALVAGGALAIVAHSMWTFASPPEPSWVDGAALTGSLLAAAAGAHPSMRHLSDVAETPSERTIGPLRLIALGLALLVNPVVVVLRLPAGLEETLVGGAVALLTLLVLWRIGRLLAERERLRSERDRMEQRFRSLVQHAPDVVMIIDRGGTISYVSPAVRSVLGGDPDDYTGTPAVELLDPDVSEAAGATEALRGIWRSSDQAARLEVPLRHRDGSTRWVELTATNRLSDPSVEGFVANFRDVTDRKRVDIELNRLALHDPLTGLPNRVLFMERLEDALARHRRAGTVPAVLFCDLDAFKQVNDTFGHDIGDQLLTETAARLSAVLRSGDTLARLGGDEFVVICEGVTGPADARIVAERLVAAVEQPFVFGDALPAIGLSIGVALADGTSVAEKLVQRADRAMYNAKRAGRERVHVWTSDAAPTGSSAPAVAGTAGGYA